MSAPAQNQHRVAFGSQLTQGKIWDDRSTPPMVVTGSLVSPTVTHTIGDPGYSANLRC